MKLDPGLLSKVSRGRFHKELGLVLSQLKTTHTCCIPPRTSPKLRLVLTLCEIDPSEFSYIHCMCS